MLVTLAVCGLGKVLCIQLRSLRFLCWTLFYSWSEAPLNYAFKVFKRCNSSALLLQYIATDSANVSTRLVYRECVFGTIHDFGGVKSFHK